MKKIYLIFGIFLVFTMFGYSHNSYAQTTPGSGGILVKCAGVNGSGECGFTDLISQINAVINFLLYISVVLATISFVYCGLLFLTAGGDVGKAKKAREIFFKVVIGFLWIFGAWLIVHFITGAFGLDPKATLLQQQ